MSKKEKEKSGKVKSGKEVKGEGKEKKAAKADKPGTAKYTYPKDCTSDADKKKYRSMARAGKEADWAPAGTAAKASAKGKKDPGTAKAVILDGKGKKVRTEENTGGKKSKKSKKSED